MLQLSWKGRTASIAPFIVATAAAIAASTAPPSDPIPAVKRLPADAARMYGLVKTPHPGELRWQQIPWLTDLAEAVRQAKAESRPLVLFVSGDDPLEKC
jgi:hypothetical protein